MNKDSRSGKNYGFMAFLPMIIFLGLYVGCGIYFTIQGTESPFGQMPWWAVPNVRFAGFAGFGGADRRLSEWRPSAAYLGLNRLTR